MLTSCLWYSASQRLKSNGKETAGAKPATCMHFLQARAYLCMQCEVQVVGKEQVAPCACGVERIREVREQPAGTAVVVYFGILEACR
jgi:hypothetical protein